MKHPFCFLCASAIVFIGNIVFAQIEVGQTPIEIPMVQPKTPSVPPVVEVPEIDFTKPEVVKEIDETKALEEKPIVTQEIKAEEAEDLSYFQKYLMGKMSLSVSRRVSHFGYNFFSQRPESFTPVVSLPVTAGYVIGPGDEIRINVWGMLEGRWNLVVDRDGNIDIPTVGVVSVAGLTYQNLENFLKKELSKHYKEFQINVSMGRLRTIPVYLVGNVRKPGNYTVSSLSTLVNALFVSGGPTTSGTMRDIHLKRNGTTIVRFDMYDFLLKGDKTKDVRLQPEDVIFIPPAGPMVAIVGQVVNPAIYELKGPTSLTALIKMAGGIVATGYTKRIQVERIFQKETKIILDKDFDELSDKEDINLADGDIVMVYPIADMIINAVTLTGNVVRPGQYQWKEGMRVSDIIKDAQALLPETNFDYALIERLQPPTMNRQLLFFNLGKAILEKDPAEDNLLQTYDIIRVYSMWEVAEPPEVRITGPVNKPGSYQYRENMKVSDLVKLAGGLKYFAYLQEAELTRVTPTPTGPETQRFHINLEKALQEHPEDNILLKQDDYLFIRSVPDWKLYEIVTIRGEVKFPGVYTIKKGETVTSIIGRAGGFTEEAYLRGAVFTREEVRKIQKQQIDTMIDKLEMELLAPRSLPAESTAADIEQEGIEMKRKRELIAKLRATQPTGRVVISLTDAPVKKIYDIPLEAGDTITIPKNPGVINVLGSVYNSASFVYDGKLNYNNYIQMAGGLTPTADRREIYIIKVDGTIVKPGRQYTLEAGDAVVVPEKMEIVSVRREIRNIVDVLFKAAVIADVIKD